MDLPRFWPEWAHEFAEERAARREFDCDDPRCVAEEEAVEDVKAMLMDRMGGGGSVQVGELS